MQLSGIYQLQIASIGAPNMKPDMKKQELSALLYEFLEVIYLFKKKRKAFSA